MTTDTPAPTPSRFRIAALIMSMAFLALIATACAPSPDAGEPSTAPADVGVAAMNDASPLPNPEAVFPDGFSATIELAITPDELAQGLMFRPNLPDDRGMLLVFTEERLPNIWMMNTLVALDLVYLDRSGRVVDVITDAQPCPGEPCPRFTPKQPAQAVLEIPAGGATQHSIVVGTVLEFSNVPGFPVTTPSSD
jgi:uncharacterized membrane protein (UPF0127 family)